MGEDRYVCVWGGRGGGGGGGERNEAEMKKALRIFAVAIRRPNIAIFFMMDGKTFVIGFQSNYLACDKNRKKARREARGKTNSNFIAAM